MFAGYTRQLTGQATRHIAGRTFIQTRTPWVDTLAQSRPAEEKAARVTLNSDAYLDLIARHPEAARRLSVGPSVQVVIGGMLYEVVEG